MRLDFDPIHAGSIEGPQIGNYYRIFPDLDRSMDAGNTGFESLEWDQINIRQHGLAFARSPQDNFTLIINWEECPFSEDMESEDCFRER